MMEVKPLLKIAKAQSGYGLALLMVFMASTILIGTSFQLISSPVSMTTMGATSQSNLQARQVAMSGLEATIEDIETKLNSGATVDLTYRYPASGTNTISAPTDPGNLADASTTIGNYYSTLTLVRGNTYMIKVTATANATTIALSKLLLASKTSTSYKADLRIIGRNAGDNLDLWSIRPAGDLNGDGFQDVICGTSTSDGSGVNSGEAYIIFGRSSASWASLVDSNADFNMDNFSEANRTIRITARAAGDNLAEQISGVGDADNDGYDDFIIGARFGDTTGANAGEAYLIFGRPTANWDALTDASGNLSLTVSSTKANRIVRFLGKDTDDQMGEAVGKLGDINGDGYDDVGLSAAWADTERGADTGEFYVIFGRSAANWDALTNVSNDFDLDLITEARRTLRFIGMFSFDLCCYVGPAGDFNNDGYDDFLAGVAFTDTFYGSSGEVYLLTGRSEANWYTLSDVNGLINMYNANTEANKIYAFVGRAGDNIRGILTTVGDIDKDTYDDFIIGTGSGDGGGADSGDAYLVFGRDLTSLDALTDNYGYFNITTQQTKANRVYRFTGRNAGDNMGIGGYAFDLDQDTYPDFLLGTGNGDTAGANSGEAYIIFGRSAANWSSLVDASGIFNLDLSSRTNRVFRLLGRNAGDMFGHAGITGLGDVDGDGYGDFVSSAYMADNAGGTDAGELYLIFGRSATDWLNRVDSNGDYNMDLTNTPP